MMKESKKLDKAGLVFELTISMSGIAESSEQDRYHGFKFNGRRFLGFSFRALSVHFF